MSSQDERPDLDLSSHSRGNDEARVVGSFEPQARWFSLPPGRVGRIPLFCPGLRCRLSLSAGGREGVLAAEHRLTGQSLSMLLNLPGRPGGANCELLPLRWGSSLHPYPSYYESLQFIAPNPRTALLPSRTCEYYPLASYFIRTPAYSAYQSVLDHSVNTKRAYSRPACFSRLRHPA